MIKEIKLIDHFEKEGTVYYRILVTNSKETF